MSDKTNEKLENLQMENEKLRKSVAASVQTIKSKNKKIKKLETQKTSVQKELNRMKVLMKNRMKQYENRLVNLGKDLKRAQDDVARVERDPEFLMWKLETLRQANNELRRRLQWLRGEQCQDEE